MVKWLDKVMDRQSKNESSRFKMVMEILMMLLSDRNGQDYITVRCNGYNERFMELMNEFDVVFWIDEKYTTVYVEKISFFRKFSDKYPLVFSSVIMKEMCGIDWDSLDSINYRINAMKESLENVLLDTMMKEDGLLIKYSQDEIDDLYKIVNNINSDVMGEVVSRQIKSLLRRYVDSEKGMICLGTETKLFRSITSSVKYKEKLIENGFLEISPEEYDNIISKGAFDTPYVNKLINPGDKVNMVFGNGKILTIVKLLKMYPPIFPSMSCFRKAMNVANSILFGSKKKKTKDTWEVKVFSFKANRFQSIYKIPFVRRSTFKAIKPYLTKYLDLIFKYVKEYPFVVGNDWILKFLFNFDKEEDIRVVLERIKEEYVMRSAPTSNDSELYLTSIIRNEGLLTNNMAKKLLIMEYSEGKIIYNKINKILWMNKELDIEIGGNINKKISYALSRDDMDFRLDDIKYSLIKSFCDEYKDVNIVDAFDFFDNVYFEKNNGAYGWYKSSNAKERRDIIYYMISKRYIEMNQLFNTDLKNVRLQDESDVTPYGIGNLAEILCAIRNRLNLPFDWVSKFFIANGYRELRVGVLYDVSTKTVVLDMRERFAMVQMHPLCQEWVDKNIVNRIYICTEYNSDSNYISHLEESTDFIYDPGSLSKDSKMYEVYDRNTGFRYKKDICIYDGSNDAIVYYSDGCEYAAKKNEMISYEIE